MARILVTEVIAEKGLDALRDAGHEVDVRLGLTPDELLAVIPGAVALIIRSATKVTAEVLEAADQLVVVGRAGVGIDNVDLEEATRRGVMVVNAPTSNVVSNAEHTMALLLAQARNLPQAHAALVEGRWERSRWEGAELHGKTLALLGLGRVGSLVAQRAHAFGMRVIAWDKFVTAERARQMGVELVELDEAAARADFVAVCLVKKPEYMGIVGRDFLAKAKPELRVINNARGGLVDEDALADAVREKRIAGAAIDVFAEEPTTSSPLFGLDSVVVTPHLGASTREAQDKAGVTIAEQVALALEGEFVPFAVNVSAAEAAEAVRPFVPLAERLGTIFAQLSGSIPEVLEVGYQGGLAEYDVSLLTLSALKGVLSVVTDEPVSFVNAPAVLKERGSEVRESKTSTSSDYVNLITLRGGEYAIAGTLAGLKSEHRIVMVDDHTIDVPPSRHMLVVRNDDIPGMVATVSTALFEADVNIADMGLGKSPEGATGLQVYALDDPVPLELVDRLRAAEGIVSVHSVTLP
jgi:D-3-phosphoglycerate dehydrogenase